MDWSDEAAWWAISLVSGLLLAGVLLGSGKLEGARPIAVAPPCVAAFYVLSILTRIQNQRGRLQTGKPVIDERYLKLIDPILGFGIGMAILLA